MEILFLELRKGETDGKKFEFKLKYILPVFENLLNCLP